MFCSFLGKEETTKNMDHNCQWYSVTISRDVQNSAEAQALKQSRRILMIEGHPNFNNLEGVT